MRRLTLGLAFRPKKQNMRIDIHTHFQCLDFVKHLGGRSRLPKTVLDGGTYVIECAAGLKIPAFPKMIDMERNSATWKTSESMSHR